jgi:trimeric autotransporter adhesin
MDINQHASPVSSQPTALGKLGELVLIAAQAPVGSTSAALVRSDGTPAGTFTVKTYEGTGPVTTAWLTPPSMQVGSRAYFVANEAATGSELWVTDGTASGTRMVADVTPGNGGDMPRLLAPFNGGIAFAVHDDNFVHQLYVTDGTAAGTKVLTHFTDSNTGPALDSLAVAGGKMYFLVQEAPCCTVNLWVSDGTPAGTHAVPGLSAFGTSLNVRSLRALGSKLLLIASTASNGSEILTVDSATDAIAMIDVSPGNDSGAVSDITILNGYGYFVGRFHSGDEELWRTDGTLAGTLPVTNVNPGPGSGLVYPYNTIQHVGGKLVFAADDGVHGVQLWSTDGLPGHETPLTAVSGYSGFNTNFAQKTEKRLYFTGGTSAGVTALFSTDGTPAGTHIVPETFLGEAISLISITGDAVADYLRYSSNGPGGQKIYRLFRYTPSGMQALTQLKSDVRALGDRTFLAANGKLLSNFDDETIGNELWVSDEASTRTLANLSPEIDTDGSAPAFLTEWNGKLIFVATDPTHGSELWESDGTTAGTRLVADVLAGQQSSSPRNLVVWNGALYFIASDGSANHLMRLPAPGTAPEVLAEVEPLPLYWWEYGAVASYCLGPTAAALGNKLYWSVGKGNDGFELWATDGTAAGTAQVADIYPGFGSSRPCDLTAMGNRLYFRADGGPDNGGSELWSTDGTQSGTVRVADIAPGPASSSVTSLSIMGSTLFFSATNGTSGIQAWKSDGTAAGTIPLVDNGGLAAHPVGATKGKMFFLKIDNTSAQTRYDLWTSNGTSAGTLRLPQVQVATSAAGFLVSPYGVYFVNAADSDAEPWITDGTGAGTRRVADLDSSGSSSPVWFANFRGATIILTNDTTGAHIWRTDGTASGTKLLGSGALPANIGGTKAFAVAGQNLFYTGHETVTGSELYVVPNDRPTAVADSGNASNGQNVTINVTNNDADSDGSLVLSSVQVVQAPSHGTTSAAANGTVIYTPTAGYAGSDSFTYTVADEQGFASNAATVTLTVTAAPPPSPPGNGGGSGGGGGGGGQLGWLEVLLLSLAASLRLAWRPSRQRHAAVNAH